MKMFGRTSGYYLFWTGFVYFFTGLYLALTHSEYTHYATMTWLFVISIPLWCPPVARHFNMEPPVFDFFKNKSTEPSNVVQFPEPKLVPPQPEVKEVPPKVFYRIGATDQHRIAFSMGMSEITMNKVGCQQMIDQLTVFMNQLEDEEGTE